MARIQGTTSTGRHDSVKRKRPGVHSKSRTSNLKNSKHYVKKYRGQGK